MEYKARKRPVLEKYPQFDPHPGGTPRFLKWFHPANPFTGFWTNAVLFFNADHSMQFGVSFVTNDSEIRSSL